MPKWSADGKYILYSSTNRKKNVKREIYLMNADGSGQVRLTDSGKRISTDPQWFADGWGIYFQMPAVKQEYLLDLATCRVEGINGKEVTPKLMDCNKNPIRRLELDSNNRNKYYEEKLKVLREIARQRIGLFEIYPSPNDKYMILYFTKTRTLELCDAKGTIIKDFKSVQAGRPAWAKDSKKIAYCADSASSSPAFVIYDLEKSHYEEIKLGMGPDIACGELSWNRDSKHIVYSCGRPFSEEDDSWLYILDLQTKKSEKLIQGNSPDWF
jgi:Tol biopolymer transport system component